MAVKNYFTDNASSVGEKSEPGSNAQGLITMVKTFEIASGDEDTSTYLFFKSVPSSFRPLRATLMCDAITGSTDNDIGLYNPRTGVVVDKDILLDGQTLASASKTLNGIGSVAIEDIGNLKSLAELLSLTPSTALAAYDIVLTSNTVGSADGTVTLILEGFAA